MGEVGTLMIEPGEEGKNGESSVEENVRMVVSSSEVKGVC